MANNKEPAKSNKASGKKPKSADKNNPPSDDEIAAEVADQLRPKNAATRQRYLDFPGIILGLDATQNGIGMGPIAVEQFRNRLKPFIKTRGGDVGLLANLDPTNSIQDARDAVSNCF